MSKCKSYLSGLFLSVANTTASAGEVEVLHQ